MLIRDHRHGKEGKKHQTAVLPKEKHLFYEVKSVNEHGLTCVVVRSDGVGKRSLHVNDVFGLPQQRKRQNDEDDEEPIVLKPRKRLKTVSHKIRSR